MSTEPTVDRIYARDLRGLDVNGIACEACGRHMHAHEWADLDLNGVVVSCPHSQAPTTTDPRRTEAAETPQEQR